MKKIIGKKVKKNNIKNIIKQAKSLNSYQEKLDFLHNRFEGEICYILGCGPSLLDVDKQKLSKELESNLCLSIKVIYFSFLDLVDFHFFNCNNFKNYPYNDQTFVISQSDFCTEEQAKKSFWGSQENDINFTVGRQPKEQTLTRTKDFDNWLLSKSGINRPWGPGIMHESVLFFAYHLGCKEIRTIGWDYKDPLDKRKISHFYEEEWRISKLKNPAAQPYEGEILDTINLANNWLCFLEKEGKTIKVFDSDKCFIHERLRRYSI